jgi:hypothetical protein
MENKRAAQTIRRGLEPLVGGFCKLLPDKEGMSSLSILLFRGLINWSSQFSVEIRGIPECRDLSNPNLVAKTWSQVFPKMP